MPELGGPTTQSGILYQNTIAALCLGQLCSKNVYPDHERVVEVRCETLDEVDDIVITYADGHRNYCQAKEILDPSGPHWAKLWQDFVRQFSATGFRPQCDLLTLYVGETRDEFRHLNGIVERAIGSDDFDCWHERLNTKQISLLKKLQLLIESQGISLQASENHLLMRCIRIRQESLSDLEFSIYRDLPVCNIKANTLFGLLRDKVGSHARIRRPFRSEELLAALLSDHGIEFHTGSNQTNSTTDFKSYISESGPNLRWFVSSRLKDDCLREERDAVIAAINETVIVLPWACEQEIPAGEYPYEETCIATASRSDGLVLVLADDISSMCRKEYFAAYIEHKPCHIFIKAGSVPNHETKIFLDEQRRRGSNTITFRSSVELKSLVAKSLNAECVRAFRGFNHARISTSRVTAGMQ